MQLQLCGIFCGLIINHRPAMIFGCSKSKLFCKSKLKLFLLILWILSVDQTSGNVGQPPVQLTKDACSERQIQLAVTPCSTTSSPLEGQKSVYSTNWSTLTFTWFYLMQVLCSFYYIMATICCHIVAKVILTGLNVAGMQLASSLGISVLLKHWENHAAGRSMCARSSNKTFECCYLNYNSSWR